jgi:MoxR-like ATPase
MEWNADLIEALTGQVIGRRREIEQAVAALAAERHLLLEGPPGTGKSTLLRSIAQAIGTGFEFVEGNAELTPGRLVGMFDPAAVLEAGYSPEVFIDGPLAAALRDGSLLYLEEVNRIPEETLNVLISVMSEGELHIPRLGRLVAAPGFRLVAAMNPFDAVGTARISGAVYDRVCRLVMGYQPADDEMMIVARDATAATQRVGPGFLLTVVELVRATRQHADLRTGSSVRGAIDVILLCDRLSTLRDTDPADGDVTLDACLLALSGRVRVREGCGRTPEDVVTELWRRFLAPPDVAEESSGTGDNPKA